MDEYDRLVQNQNPKSTRLRIFLFSNGEEYSRTNSITSLLHGTTNRDNWFIDALNSGASSGLERGRSEASSIVSEVPDYLFGLDNPDDPQNRGEAAKFKIRPVLQENVSVSDPGSPAPVVSSPFCSTSSVPTVQSIPNLPPVKTKPDNLIPMVESNVSTAETRDPTIPQPVGFPGNPMLHYVTDPRYSGQPVHPLPVYYVPSSVPPGNVPIQHVPIRAPYIQVQQYPLVAGQVPVGYQHHPVPGVDHVYGGGLRPATSLDPRDGSGATSRLVPDGVNHQHQMLYGVRNQVSGYPGMAVPVSGEDLRGPGSGTGTGPELKTGKVNLSS